MKQLAAFVRERRKDVNLMQEQFTERAGVALTVVRKIEQGKQT
jgi:transcriptional regulator with XRE-family HTH domain